MIPAAVQSTAARLPPIPAAAAATAAAAAWAVAAARLRRGGRLELPEGVSRVCHAVDPQPQALSPKP